MSIIEIPTKFHQDSIMFDDKCCRESVVFVTDHVPQKYAKGAVSPYKMCGKLCKKYNLDVTHLKVLWKNQDIFRDYSRPANTFWELLHDQIVFLHEDKSWVCIEQSNILDQLKQKIPLRHISKLVGDFLIPEESHKQFYNPTPGQINAQRRTILEGFWEMEDVLSPQKFRGIGVCINRFWTQGFLPLCISKALKYFKIHFFDARKQKNAKMISSDINIMGEIIPPCMDDVPSLL